MVDLGPLGPWSGPPSMAIPALERWHASWERDHPELLGLAGPSFYRPGMDELLGGITMAEASANLFDATERLRDSFSSGMLITTREPQCDHPGAEWIVSYYTGPAWLCEECNPPLPPLHVDPLLITWQPK